MLGFDMRNGFTASFYLQKATWFRSCRFGIVRGIEGSLGASVDLQWTGQSPRSHTKVHLVGDMDASDAISNTSPPSKQHQLLEIVQYTCESEELPTGEVRPRCFPIPRIFRIYPGKPAVEVTKLLRIDLKTGEVELPDEFSEVLPKGKCWRDISRYNIDPGQGPAGIK
ncbi:hypothetical protein BJ138DRAFT_117082 [Hygrophoropsis aurantiaca]|uniref:Uncharacterized protein n=1 Tax=Hygrophoropsis aurantiaca TaxID=72124 RepID=A0ACB8ACE0_9AGAM|nr:hypothetical protein BJ138DRAFT_117082 [Hygrophoropsis aurantiaca]